LRPLSTTSSELGKEPGAMVHLEIDSKAMRKQNRNDTLFGVLQVTEAGTAVAIVDFNTRTLDKLP